MTEDGGMTTVVVGLGVKWRMSERKEGKIKSDTHYFQNEKQRKTEETARMQEQRHVIIGPGSWEQGGVVDCTLGV